MKKFFLFVLIFIGLFSGVQATWWNSSWSHYQQINITELSGNNLVNYSTIINITYNSNMNVSFQDLRFINSSHNGELSYYIDQRVNSSWAYVYVKIPSYTASSITTIYMYYGNSSVLSTSNESNVGFYLYDNFEDGTYNLSHFVTGSMFNASISGRCVSGTCMNMSSGSNKYATAIRDVNMTNVSISYYVNMSCRGYTSRRASLGVSLGNPNESFYVWDYNHNEIYDWADDGLVGTGSLNYSVSVTNGTQLVEYTNNRSQFRVYIDKKLTFIWTNRWITGYWYQMGWSSSSGTCRNAVFDDLIARPYYSPEPSYVFGTEQSAMVSVCWSYDSSLNQYYIPSGCTCYKPSSASEVKFNLSDGFWLCT